MDFHFISPGGAKLYEVFGHTENPERQAFRILSYLNQFRLKPVWVDAHIAPANGTGFTGISGEFEAAQGRTESSAPTSPLMLKVYFLEFM